MATRQVLVQMDESLVKTLDREARRKHLSRSEVIRRAITAWFQAAKIAEAERRSIDSYRRHPEDPAMSEALTRIAAESALPYDA